MALLALVCHGPGTRIEVIASQKCVEHAVRAILRDRSLNLLGRSAGQLVENFPIRSHVTFSAAHLQYVETLHAWERPFLTAFGDHGHDRDPVFRGADRVLQREVPGAAGQPHTVLPGAGHFIQEDRGPELARIVADFVARTA